MTVSSPSPPPDGFGVIVTSPVPDWHPITGNYCETYWLPVIGPTAWCVARRLGLIGTAAGYDEVVQHHSAVLGRSVGVGVAQLFNAIGRVTRFGLAHWMPGPGGAALHLRGSWPPLPRRHFDKISDFVPPET